MWDADLEKKIEALTPDQVVATLRKYVDPKKLVIVTAGDFETKATASAQ
jgi:zinc protease